MYESMHALLETLSRPEVSLGYHSDMVSYFSPFFVFFRMRPGVGGSTTPLMFLGRGSTVRFRRVVAGVYHTCTQCVAQKHSRVVLSRRSFRRGEAGSKSVRFAVLYRAAAAVMPIAREAFWATRM